MEKNNWDFRNIRLYIQSTKIYGVYALLAYQNLFIMAL